MGELLVSARIHWLEITKRMRRSSEFLHSGVLVAGIRAE